MRLADVRCSPRIHAGRLRRRQWFHALPRYRDLHPSGRKLAGDAESPPSRSPQPVRSASNTGAPEYDQFSECAHRAVNVYRKSLLLLLLKARIIGLFLLPTLDAAPQVQDAISLHFAAVSQGSSVAPLVLANNLLFSETRHYSGEPK